MQILISVASLFLIVLMLTCAEEEKVQSHRSKGTYAKCQSLLHLHNRPKSPLDASTVSGLWMMPFFPNSSNSWQCGCVHLWFPCVIWAGFARLADWFFQIRLDLSTHQHANSREKTELPESDLHLQCLEMAHVFDLPLTVMVPNSPSWALLTSSRTRRWCN